MSEPLSEFEVFTAEEYVRAFELFLPRDQAIAEAERLAEGAKPQPEFPHATMQLSPDILYLLSLVSEDCAVRAYKLAKVSAEDFTNYQSEIRNRLGL
jgi:hypothetical protein